MIAPVAVAGNATKPLSVALVGNPNSGKTTLFNALTGLRQKVGNYPGVTVEKKEGRVTLPNGQTALLLDLPGLYSVTPNSPDEVISREVLMGLRADTPAPDLILNIVDASNLERNLYLTSQLLDLGTPMVIALTMTDAADKEGVKVRAEVLEKQLGVPVRVVVASRQQGLRELLKTLERGRELPCPEPAWIVPPTIAADVKELRTALEIEHHLPPRFAFAESITLLMQEDDIVSAPHISPTIRDLARKTRERLADHEIDFAAVAIEARYHWIAKVCTGVVSQEVQPKRSPLLSHDKIDRIVMHPFWGYVLFLLVMTTVFQAIFTLGQAPVNFLKGGVDQIGTRLAQALPPGDLTDLLHDGILAGVGNTIGFLPQILLLFFFVSLLEDTGYMARAAFLMDRLMSKVGLHGKSFIPMLSSFGCAIPGIMATRTIGDRKARLITILVAPLMSCSARLPVYALMISAFIPGKRVLGIGSLTLLTLPGLTLVAMYFLGMTAAFCMAWLFHRTLLKGVAPTFLLELPPYRTPSLKTVLFQMVERAGLFLKRAATVILAVSVVLWALAYYPKHPELPTGQERLEHSYVGMMGRTIEPLIRPLGFDWKMGIGIVSSFVAREVFVSAMGTVYNVEKTDDEKKGEIDLGNKMRDDIDPRTGQHVFTPLVAVCLMVYYVLAMQCMSTVAVVRRETNGWKWPIFQLVYMSALAWIVTFLVYHGGHLLGFH
jgi:ferrous iron transport protein B